MRIAYRIVTVLMAVLMSLSGVPDVLMIKEAVEVFTHLGYPTYILPFIGVAKILGAVGVVQPWFPRLKEWAYAGLAIDVVGAAYSHLSVGDGLAGAAPAIVGFVLVMASYGLYRRTSSDA
jgi:uncharacterized membrane protein YphA (DoxX/SURF4 family)